ncbi:NlpC/P60 family N-terminal domain-containing protein [uncultured Desulfuromonas sp.]|uniref:NlpC/P60 family N-terminal domain-containing protein n=2 Tax=Desulfuromonas TaxID=890 RepID=UPI002621F878|nr:NlpC/P60 family N-terminal domain-containing protein [uncultured Desulfuromonas sp.]
MRKIPALILATMLLLATGCVPDLSHKDIADLKRMPQNPLAYLDPATAHRPLLSHEEQQKQALAFLERHFAPWHTNGPLESTRSPFWAVDWVGKKAVFGENLRPVGQDRLQALVDRAAPETYPSLNLRAITVRLSDLRALPTRRPLFLDPDEAGEGFPFDYLQHAAVQANTPLHVIHRSQDGAWVFAETSLAYGWMPVTDLAWVDGEFARAFDTGTYLAPTRDRVPVFDTDGLYRFSTGIGTLLPLTGDGSHEVFLAVADENRRALLAKALLPPDSGETFPLPLTPLRLASLAGNMVGQAYGWGESFADRDCSATVRDLFAPFGLWLPRNSSKQAMEGTVVPLSGLSPSRRERRLLDEGVPFLTLVRVPGHIMLYIGEHEDRAALLHTLWGVRTRNLWNREGRWIVGKTAITTLEPGLEQASLSLGVSSLRRRVESMNLLLSPGRP